MRHEKWNTTTGGGGRDAVNPDHTVYHPKWHRDRMPIFWWLRKLSYARFISRELTSLFVAYAVIVLLIQVWTLTRGEAAYARFLEWLRSMPMLVIHGAVFVAVLFHTITWLNLTPKALSVRLGTRRVPGGAVLAAHYVAWLAVSALLAYVLLRR